MATAETLTAPSPSGAGATANLPAPIAASAAAGGGRIRAFRFGDAEAVLDRRDLISYAEARFNGRWYDPPMPMAGLARLYRATPHNSSAIQYKRDQLLRHFEETRWLGRKDFGEFVLNYLSMGNGYLERRDNLAGAPLVLRNSPAIYTRRGRDPNQFWWVPGYRQDVQFRDDRVFQLAEPDLAQEIYGLPEYIAAMQSGLLNEQATLFRRRYYQNGSHAGFVFYLSEPSMSEEDAEAIEDALEDSKGIGNFRNLFIHAPAGKKDGVQILPIGEVAAKDEFLGIKDATREDVLAAHRVPPVLLGVVPKNAGGLGSMVDAANAFHVTVIEPLQLRMLEVNAWLGVEAVRFRPFSPMSKTPSGDGGAGADRR